MGAKEATDAKEAMPASAGASIDPRHWPRRHIVNAAAGALAWLTTLAPVVVGPGAGPLARGGGLAAFFCLIAGAFVRLRKPSLGRLVGLWGFLFCTALCWVFGRETVLEFSHLSLFAGQVFWVVFGASWPEPWSVPEGDLQAVAEGTIRGLEPRRRVPLLSLAVMVIAAVGATGALWFGWRAGDSGRSVAAHLIAVLVAVALLGVGARAAVAMATPSDGGKPSGRRSATALMWAAVSLLFAVGAWFAFRAG